MIDDEVAAWTSFTVLAYWKFESIFLQQRVVTERFQAAQRKIGEVQD